MNSNDSDILSYNNTSYQMSSFGTVLFWSYLLLDLPSTICSFFLLYQFLTKRILRHAMNNHTIIAITISSLGTHLIDVPLSLIYARLGIVWPQTPFICVVWWLSSNAMFATTNILLAWASFERHIIIFHDKWLLTNKKRWLIHYLPLIFFSLYPLIFYIPAVFIPSCDQPFVFDYNLPVCGWLPCYLFQTGTVMYDIWANGILPSFIIAIFSTSLLFRVIWQRHIRLHRPIQWQKYRKLTIQMLSLSIVFLIFNLPFLVYVLLEFANALPPDINPDIFNYLIFLTGFCILLLPFITILSLPTEFWIRKWQNSFKSTTHNNVVVPM